MKIQKYVAEFVGTFALTFLVLVSLTTQTPLSTPVIAAVTLGIFVYTLGGISGAHFNPAITISILGINKIKVMDAVYYIIVQFIGAAAAMGLIKVLMPTGPGLMAESTVAIGIAEGIGAVFLAFAVTSVTLKKVDSAANGLVIGSSLLIGILCASAFSNGVLNPAVAFGIGSLSIAYVVGPIIGGIFGAFLACFLHGEKVQFGR